MCILHVRRLLNSLQLTLHIEVKHEVISVLKKAEEIDNERRDVEMKKMRALVLRQICMRIVK